MATENTTGFHAYTIGTMTYMFDADHPIGRRLRDLEVKRDDEHTERKQWQEYCYKLGRELTRAEANLKATRAERDRLGIERDAARVEADDVTEQYVEKVRFIGVVCEERDEAVKAQEQAVRFATQFQTERDDARASNQQFLEERDALEAERNYRLKAFGQYMIERHNLVSKVEGLEKRLKTAHQCNDRQGDTIQEYLDEIERLRERRSGREIQAGEDLTIIVRDGWTGRLHLDVRPDGFTAAYPDKA